MSDEPVQPKPISPDAEPQASQAAVPVWLLVLLLVLIYGGMVYFDENGGWFEPTVYAPYRSLAEVQEYQPVVGDQYLQNGRKHFEQVCALCHNTAGTGNPNQAPPFVGSEWVLGSPNRLIRVPLYGLQSPITVHGQQFTFAQPMPPMGVTMSEEDLADTLSYMRQAWGNKAPRITAEQVKAVKATVGNRSQAFTPEELSQVPE